MRGVVHYPESPKLDTLLSFSCALTPFQLPSYRAQPSDSGPPPRPPSSASPANQREGNFYFVHFQKYKEFEKSVRVEEIDGVKLVKNLAVKMEEMFRRKAEATRVGINRLVEAAEEAHHQHEENPDLQYEYFNAVLINEVDEEGNNVELGGEFLLEPNDHFNNLSVNLSLSVVQVPTNMYNKDPDIVNGVYWSEALNKVFVDNFERDPSLIWQYFGSAKGFFRQYPGEFSHSPFLLCLSAFLSLYLCVCVCLHLCAFSLSLQFNQTGHGSVCSQAIMLVTDGATEMYDDVFEKYNWPDRKISTLADVQENVMRYLHVMSRPKVIDHEHDTIWTEAYVDSALVSSQPHLMTTVAMPVFSTKNETKNQGILLGVVGTDIPLQELMKIIPKHLLGIHGYAFAITNNGYILTHPDLRPLYQDGQKRRKPNYSSVDLSEVEWEDKDDIVRVKTNTYQCYVEEINKVPFFVGVALSRGHGKYFFRGNVSVEAGYGSVFIRDVEAYDVTTWICLDNRTYCNTDEHHEHRHLTQIQAIKLFLTGRRPHLKCDRELIQEVLFDAVVTAPLEAYWTGLALNKSENSDKGVEIAYLGTRTGLSRTNLFVAPEQLSNQDFLTAEDKEGVFNADHFPLWYKRAAEQVPGTFVYSIPFSSVYVLWVLCNSAVGIQMKLEFFQRKFWTACRQCSSLDGKCSISCDNEDINCYLIDNNGFILVTEVHSQVLIKHKKKCHQWKVSLL
uniref:Calcium channel, voltage dependent, alpha2/delta subunit 3 n=1 Tax=Myripristis murdjan TaxID=586833 RepID=A0A667YIN5_9TELE